MRQWRDLAADGAGRLRSDPSPVIGLGGRVRWVVGHKSQQAAALNYSAALRPQSLERRQPWRQGPLSREPQEPAGSWRSGTYRRSIFILYGAGRGMASTQKLAQKRTFLSS